MAMSGGTAKLVKATKSNYGSGFDIKLYVYYKSSQDVSTNKSTVSVGMYVVTPSGYGIGSWAKSSDSYVGTTSLTFNGAIPNFSGTRWLVENKTFTVSHKDDGTASATIHWKWGVNSPWGQMVNPSGSFTITLPTIPRKSDFTIKGTGTTSAGYPYLAINGANALTISILRKSSSFTHKVVVGFDDVNSSKSGIGKSHSVKPSPNQWLKFITNAKNTCSLADADAPYVTVTTYDASGNPIGSVKKRWDIYVPNESTMYPTVKLTVAPVHSLADKFDDLYIQGKSKVEGTIESTPKYEAKVKSCKLAVGSASYTATASNSTSKESGVLSTAGKVTVKATTTDSRGYSGSDSEDITVIPYSKPYLSNIVCERSDENGKYKDDGTYLHIKCTRNVSSVNSLNNSVVTVSCAGHTETILNETTSANTFDGVIPNVTLDTMSVYSVTITIDDDIESSKDYIMPIPTALCSLHLGKGGNKAAFGGYATKDNTLQVYWDLEAHHISKIDFYDGYDFNELIYQTGYYPSTSAPSSAKCSNYPIDKTGVLEVISQMSQNKDTGAWWGFAWQTYRTLDDKIYTRSYYSSSGFTPWVLR